MEMAGTIGMKYFEYISRSLLPAIYILTKYNNLTILQYNQLNNMCSKQLKSVWPAVLALILWVYPAMLAISSSVILLFYRYYFSGLSILCCLVFSH